jgi:hypothetical protein
MSADRFGDVASWHALFRDVVKDHAGGRVLERQPEEACGVQPVHRGPAVGHASDVGRDAFGAGDVD